MDVELSVCGSLQHLKAVRAALSGCLLRLLRIHSGESPPQTLSPTSTPPQPATRSCSPKTSPATSHLPTTPCSPLSSSATPHSPSQAYTSSPFQQHQPSWSLVMSSPDVSRPSSPQLYERDNPSTHDSFDNDETRVASPPVHVVSEETVTLPSTQSQRDFSPELFDSPTYSDTTIDLHPDRPPPPPSPTPHYLLYVPRSGDTTPELSPPTSP